MSGLMPRYAEQTARIGGVDVVVVPVRRSVGIGGQDNRRQRFRQEVVLPRRVNHISFMNS